MNKILINIFIYTLFLILYCDNVTCATSNSTTPSPIPIVLWHGMGDSCCNPLSLGRFSSVLEKELPGVVVKSLRIGNNFAQDTENGYFMDVNKQVRLACAMIRDDPELQNGYNAIGFSQGAQFLRAVAQRCPSPSMKTLVSMGGQHQGVYGIPHCLYPGRKWCDYVRRVLNKAAYASWVQNRLVQAQYWHDPLNDGMYKNGSVFLADINNEKEINPEYVKNLQQLKNLVLVRFNNDSIVEPVSTEWFGFYAPGQAAIQLPLEQTQIYLEDRLGLKAMADSKRLHFLATDGDHLQFSHEWFVENILKPYLSPV